MSAHVLGVIPARGGSRGIPQKNLALIAGCPLIVHTIRAAQGSRRLTRTVVSTDDPAIRETALACGVEAPFLRPAALAMPDARSVDVALHALAWAEADEGRAYDYLCLLEPTSPLRRPEDIDGVISVAVARSAQAVVSVVQIEAPHPVKTLLLEEGRLTPFLPDRWRPNLLRQELPPVCAVNGAVYCVRRDVLMDGRSFWGDPTLAYVMPGERSVNIDTPLDLAFAEFLLERAGPDR